MLDYKGAGYTISDELLYLDSGTDQASGITGKLGFLEYEPNPYSLELWTGAGKTGTGYTLLNENLLLYGSITADQAILLDWARGLIQVGANLPATLYASYVAKGSQLRKIELEQMEQSDIIIPLPSQIESSKVYCQGLKWDTRIKLESATINLLNPPTGGSSIIRICDGASPVGYYDLTIPEGSASVTATINLEIPTAKELYIIAGSGNHHEAGQGFIRLLKTLTRRF